LNKSNGFTLIETLIAIALITFVVISILGAFSQVQLNTRQVGDKNLALVLAESKMEELLKYPASQMTAATTIDYAIKSGNSFNVQTSNPSLTNQFRRTVSITAAGTLMNVLVTVEYAYNGASYPGRVSLNSRRGG
jgi:type II secretion system protein I